MLINYDDLINELRHAQIILIEATDDLGISF